MLSPERIFSPREACLAGVLPVLLWRAVYRLMLRLHPATPGCGDCRLRLPDIAERTGGALEPNFPVDVVYTWVDGADPAHAAKRTVWLNGEGEEVENGAAHPDGLLASRFRDNEELRYSLRSLARFAPWVRRVIVVTDGQTPAWLNADHEKIRIVDHREFIPAEYLPTFNSHVIEAFLHDIPELAEHYIYFNDDVFLAAPCAESVFFTPNGLPMGFTDWRWRRLFGYRYTKTPHALSYFNTMELLGTRGIATDAAFITAHGPYPQTRSNAAEGFAYYRDDILAFAGNRFRTTGELAFYSHALPLWLYARKRIVPCDLHNYYVQTHRWDRIAYYTGILNSLRDGAPPFFCVNDTDQGVNSLRRRDLDALLATCYPEASPYERDVPAPSGG